MLLNSGWTLILFHTILHSFSFHLVFSNELNLEAETIAETTAFIKARDFDTNWKKVPWGYSSIELGILSSHEVFIHEVMTKYEKVLEKRLQQVRQYLQDYRESVPKKSGPFWHAPTSATETAKIVAGHPIMAYRLVRRFSNQINWIQRSLKYDEGVAERLNEIRGITEWPNQRDLDRAIESILNLQHMYDFDTSTFSGGMLKNINLMTGFSKLQMLEIGETAIRLGQFALGIEWLRAGKNKVQRSLTNFPVNMTSLEFAMKRAEEHHDDEFDASDKLDLSLFETKVSGRVKLPNKRRSLFIGYDPYKLDDHNIDLRYKILCQGVVLNEPIQNNTFYCWLDNYSHPYFILHPLRTELHSFDPYVVQIHDIFSSSKMLEILVAGKEHEKMISSRSEAGNNYPVAYLDEESKKFRKFRYLEKVAEMITGLNVQGRANSESLEVSEHTFGARYSPQIESKNIENHGEGATIANFLVHMSGSGNGGLIGFPKINLIIDSSPGSAVFWYSTFKNGQPDDRTMHAHCPSKLRLSLPHLDLEFRPTFIHHF